MQNNFIFIDLFLSQKCYKRVYPKSIVHAQTKQPFNFLVVHNLLFHIKIRAIFPCTSVSLGTVLAPINQCKEVLQTCRNITKSQICSIYSAVGLPETHIQEQDL